MKEKLESNYNIVSEELEKVEKRIEDYRFFHRYLTDSFDLCEKGCNERFNIGQVLEADYVRSQFNELSENDQAVDSMLEGNLQGKNVRDLKNHCIKQISEIKKYRDSLNTDLVNIERTMAFYRHPKKEPIDLSMLFK